MRKKIVPTGIHEDDPRPYAQFDVKDGSLEVMIYELNGGDHWVARSFPEIVRAHPAGNGIADKAKQRAAQKAAVKSQIKTQMKAAKKRHTNLKLMKGYETQEHVLFINLEGNLEFIPTVELNKRPSLFAHLAWYNPVTGEWSKLEFVVDAGQPFVHHEALPDIPEEDDGWI